MPVESLNYTGVNSTKSIGQKTMKNAILIAIAGLFASAGAASAGTFVESHTSAALRGSADDSIITTINYGIYGDGMEGSLGVGYGSDGDEAVLRGEYRIYRGLTSTITLEGEVEALYGTSSDNLELRPEIRVRKYF